jgi:hypothetical protein
MSRLQVGGLALVIKGTKSDLNVGLTVELIHYDDWSGEWLAQNNDGILLINGKIDNQAWFAADRLLPIGDKQTQDELQKEKLMFESFNNLKYANCRTLVKGLKSV